MSCRLDALLGMLLLMDQSDQLSVRTIGLCYIDDALEGYSEDCARVAAALSELGRVEKIILARWMLLHAELQRSAVKLLVAEHGEGFLPSGVVLKLK